MTMFDKKTVYHSDVAKADGLTLRLKGDVRKGKYGMIVPINVMGDPPDHEYWMSIENDNCTAVMQGVPRDEWVTLTAHGSRGSASLAWKPYGNGSPDAPYEPVPVASQNAAPTGDVGLEAAMAECMLAAGRVVAVFRDEYGRDPTQVDQDLAVTMFIEANRSGRRF